MNSIDWKKLQDVDDFLSSIEDNFHNEEGDCSKARKLLSEVMGNKSFVGIEKALEILSFLEKRFFGIWKDKCQEVKEVIENIETPEEFQVVIRLRGGIINSVYTNYENSAVVILDYDTDGVVFACEPPMDDTKLTQMVSLDKTVEECYTYDDVFAYCPEDVKNIFDQLYGKM